ncbi:hypothetical protein Tco_0593252 [Tanacetum coccineum]
MSSSQNPPSKLSKKPKISVKPIWRKKINSYHSQSEVETPTTMSKPPSPCNEPLKEGFPQAYSNQPSPQSHPPPLIDPYIDGALQAPQDDNQTQHPLPQSPSKGMLVQEINQLYDLSDLLNMHLQNHITNLLPTTPSTPPIPLTITLDQVEHHVGYCPCCRYNQTQFISLREDLTWIVFLLTRPYPPLQVPHNYSTTTTSAPNSPPSNPTAPPTFPPAN